MNKFVGFRVFGFIFTQPKKADVVIIIITVIL